MSVNSMRIANFTLFDGSDHHGDARFTLEINDGVITALTPFASDDLDHCVDLAGKTVMPGLIDAHFHCNSPSLDIQSIDRLSPSHLAQHARRLLENALSAGFTTVRDAGGADVGLVAALKEGLIDGPDLYVAGKALSQTGGHGDFAPGYSICDCGAYSGHLSRVVDGADAVRQAVREHLHAGAHHIKIFVSGGVLSPTDPIWMDQFTDAEVTAAVEEARRRRTYVMAHAVSASSIRRCAELGVRSIEHGVQVDRETADIVLEAGAFIVPTMSAYRSLLRDDLGLPEWAQIKARAVVDDAAKSVAICAEAGVPLGLGTDLFGMLHGAESHELVLRAEIDGALATLRSATSINAEIMMRDKEIGRIRSGAMADLLVVDGDPVLDISLLTAERSAITAVVRRGKVARGAL